jgi:hypothetical protein
MIVPGAGHESVYALNEARWRAWLPTTSGEALRYSHDRGRWFRWDGTRWRERDNREGVPLGAHDVLSSSSDAKQLAKASTISAIERMARLIRVFAMCGDEWDRDPLAAHHTGWHRGLRSGELQLPARPISSRAQPWSHPKTANPSCGAHS